MEQLESSDSSYSLRFLRSLYGFSSIASTCFKEPGAHSASMKGIWGWPLFLVQLKARLILSEFSYSEWGEKKLDLISTLRFADTFVRDVIAPSLLGPWDYCLMYSVHLNNFSSWKFHFPNGKKQLMYTWACRHKCHGACFDDHWLIIITLKVHTYQEMHP